MRALFASMAATLASAENMNGLYMVATAGDGPSNKFNTDYASKGHQYFDVWAPQISTHYGEVFWTDQHNQPLPQEIVEKFKGGKVMAITGYEQDQVMVFPTGQPGVNPSEDVSVPINWAYNHHYMAWMTGASSELIEVPREPDDVSAHGASKKWEAMDLRALESQGVPNSQMFSEGNGGESRKSFHGYPNGYAQLIESPSTWHITPMQIDTRNRDCGVSKEAITNCTKFTPGPEPRQARYGRGIPKDTNYSGILECPCNGRFGGDPSFYGVKTKTKSSSHHYTAVASSCSSSTAIGTEGECYTAASSLGMGQVKNQTVTDSTKLPIGCSIVVDSPSGAVSAIWNAAPSSTGSCNKSLKYKGATKSEVGVGIQIELDESAGPVTFQRSKKGLYCLSNHDNVLGTYNAANSSVAASQIALSQCEAACAKNSECFYCSVDCPAGRPPCRWVALPSCGQEKQWAGLIPGDISAKMAGQATITVSGPPNVWFGVGFSAVQMSDQPYALIVNSTSVIEQKLGTCGSEADHCAGTLLAPSLKLVSNEVVNGVRTVVVTRPMLGKTSDYYSFNPSDDATIPLITAIGSSQAFAYHAAHALATVTVAAADGATCVCDQGKIGTLCDNNGQGCEKFVKNCVAPPAGSLLEQHNPTCDSTHYAGGLRCCSHGRIMLDSDQEIRPELLQYHMKFRFWYEMYDPNVNGTGKPSHYNLGRIYQQTEANAGEYDIPPAFAKPGLPIPGYPNWPLNTPTPGTSCTGTCPDGPDCECIHTIHYKWTVGPLRLLYAGGHCHAPSCISIELYRNDTGEILCRQLPVYGKGNVQKDKFDESGYVALPPCLWGDDEGLKPSVFLPAGTPLLSIKKNRNTDTGHFGEMASWQMRGVNFPPTL